MVFGLPSPAAERWTLGNYLREVFMNNSTFETDREYQISIIEIIFILFSIILLIISQILWQYSIPDQDLGNEISGVLKGFTGIIWGVIAARKGVIKKNLLVISGALVTLVGIIMVIFSMYNLFISIVLKNYLGD